MRKHILIFLGIFIFLMFPKNVFAEQIMPYYAKLNNQVFVNYPTATSNYINTSISSSIGYSLPTIIHSFDYQNDDYSFTKYPYVLMFFQSSATESELNITKNGGCTTSCFNLWNTSLRSLGKNPLTNTNQYVLILRPQKWITDCGSGSGQCIYKVEDVFNFATYTTSSKTLQFGTILLSDTDQISSVNEMQNMITNATQNTQNIINNQNQNQQQTNEKLEDINDTMQDDTAPTNNDYTNQLDSISVAPNTPVSNLVLLPINLLNRLITLSNNQCVSYDLGSFYGTNLVLPCLTLSNYFGSDLWQTIDYLICFFMIYNFAMLCIMAWEDFTSLRDDYNSLYQPKHAKGEYQPKHGGD